MTPSAIASLDGKLHGGIDAYKAQLGGNGFTQLGAETIPPLVSRGVVLDLPAVLGAPVLQPGCEITPEDLAAAADGLDLESAAVILIRTDWATHWADAATYVGTKNGVPGVGSAAAAWLADRGVLATGTDIMAFDCIPAGASHGNLPAHSLLLVDKGIYIIENLNLEALAESGFQEFLFVLVPLPIVGGTDSPARPLAIVRADG